MLIALIEKEGVGQISGVGSYRFDLLFVSHWEGFGNKLGLTCAKLSLSRLVG